MVGSSFNLVHTTKTRTGQDAVEKHSKMKELCACVPCVLSVCGKPAQLPPKSFSHSVI